MARVTALSLLLSVSSQADFLPFAGIEELKPTRLHPFCEPADEDGHRWCSRSIVKQLEDGGDVEMNWRMHVNPDNILSLDTEAEHGVRVTKCVPGELELLVPESHEGHMEAGKFIVGSHFVHGCGHLTQKHMYHRVTQVKAKSVPVEPQLRKVSRFHLATETLPHFSHMARHISFNFSYMPVEARDIGSKYPEVRTNFGQEKLWKEKSQKKAAAEAEAKTHGDRRLLDLGSLFSGSAAKPTSGTIAYGGSATGGVETSNDVVNLSPKQVSNFGWNWDFAINDTETPTFTIDKPDTKGSIIVRNPYVKAHAGCFLNFTSNFQGFMQPPHVAWQAGLKGHGVVQGRLEAAMNSTQSIDSDPATYNIPKSVMEQIPFLRLLQEFDQPVWFSKIEQSVGNVPLSIEPGFQFQMSFYHKGPFSGYLAFGGSTHGTIEPILHFDSKVGFKTTFDGELLDTDVWPPMWMVFTEAFEMGVKAEPQMLLKGDFLGFNDATAAIQIVPYMNVTVQRDGSMNFSADEVKELVVYPVRVLGIDTLSFTTKYAVKITVNGIEKTSAPAINWGEVEFHDPVNTFNMGTFTDDDAESLLVQITLYEVDTTMGTNITMGSGSFTCSSFEKGVCQPSPAFVNIVNPLSVEVAVVELSIVHEETPAMFFGSKIKGIGISFPATALNVVNLASSFPSLASTVTTDPMKLHLIHSGRTYISPLSGTIAGATATLTGQALIDLYPAFLETWGSCSAALSKCENPTIELWSGSTKIASGDVPPFGSEVTEADNTNFLASLVGAKTTTSAPIVAKTSETLPEATLYAPGSTESIAVVSIQVRLTSPASSSLYLSPKLGQQIPLEQTQEFMWSIVGADATKTYSFTLTPLAIELNSSLIGTDVSGYRAIDDNFLVPVAGAAQTISAQCQQRAVGSIPASSMPCTFVKELAFNGPTFAPGNQMVILTQWVGNDGLTHAVYSPPFEIVGPTSDGAAGGRRLEELSGPARWLQAVTVPSSEFATNPNVDDNDPNCAEKALKFNLGQGVMMRGAILSLGAPKDFPYIQQSSSTEPLYTTPWKSLGGAQPETTAEDFLPDELCEAGMCSSMLPGCRQASFKKMYFPKLVFNFSRPYFYNGTNGSEGVSTMIQNAMAWAFSAMPEAVTVMLQELAEKQKAAQASTAVQDYGFGNYNQYAKPAPSTNFFGSSTSQTSAQSATGSSSPAFKNWWSTQRRLTETGPERKLTAIDQDGKPANMPNELEQHQARVEFKDGLPYKVSHKLVKLMTRHGYFQDFDDGFKKRKGELQITGFYLEDGGSVITPLKSHGSPTGPAVFQVPIVYLAAACVAAGFAAMMALRIKSASSSTYETPAHADEAGLE